VTYKRKMKGRQKQKEKAGSKGSKLQQEIELK
jgi:hypothetical protein